MAALRIRRPIQFADLIRKYRLFVDDVQMGEIRPDSEIEIQVTPGTHCVLARIDWCSSNSLQIEIEQGQVFDLEVGSNIRGWRMYIGFIYVFFLRSQYLYLRCTS